MTPAKCPNPACPFLFDPSQVPPGAVIACPRCGMQFTLGPVPTKVPLYGPASPPAEDLGLIEERPNTDEWPTEDGLRPRRRGKESRVSDDPRPRDEYGRFLPYRGSGAAKITIYSVIGVLLVCGVIIGVLFLTSRTQQQDRDRGVAGGKQEVVFDRYQIAYTPPAGDWEADDELKRAFKATVLAVAGKEPAGWIVVDARRMEYDPTPAELHDMARQTLAPNIDGLREALDEQDATLGGVAGKRYLFDGVYQSARVTVKGEVHAVGYRKMAYLVYAFAPDRTVESVNQSFADFRAGVRLLAPPTAKGTAGFRKVFRSKLGSYTLTATEPNWRELSDPASRDGADLALSGLLGAAGGSRPNTAEVLVFVLDAGGDAAAAARKHLEETVYARPGFPLTLTPVTDDFQGDDPPSGPPGPLNPTAAVTRYEVRYENGDASSRKFVVVATLAAGKNVIVAVGESSLNQRRAWEKRLVQLVGSLAGPE